VDFIDLVTGFTHAVYELVRHLWLVLFLGWWAACGIMARKHPDDRKFWLMIPTLFTLAGLVVSIVSLMQVDTAIHGSSVSFQFDDCRSVHGDRDDCEASAEAMREHFGSLAVYVKAEGQITDRVAFWRTWVHVFGDTVSFVQIWLLWLVVPFLFFRWASSSTPIPAELDQPKRDIIHIK
jgi:hypothetical protein